MEYGKLDAPLIRALERGDRRLTVFVHLAGQPDARWAHRIHSSGPPPAVATATLSPGEVTDLARQPWVKALRLSGVKRLL